MVRPPEGCRFSPRCPFATDLCRSKVPDLMDVGDGRKAACWGYVGASDVEPAERDLVPALGSARVGVSA